MNYKDTLDGYLSLKKKESQDSEDELFAPVLPGEIVYPNTLNVRLSGDKQKASTFINFAEGKLSQLRERMDISGLKMDSYQTEFSDGTTIRIDSVLGVDVINIFTPLVEEVNPKKKKKHGGGGARFLAISVLKGKRYENDYKTAWLMFAPTDPADVAKAANGRPVAQSGDVYAFRRDETAEPYPLDDNNPAYWGVQRTLASCDIVPVAVNKGDDLEADLGAPPDRIKPKDFDLFKKNIKPIRVITTDDGTQYFDTPIMAMNDRGELKEITAMRTANLWWPFRPKQISDNSFLFYSASARGWYPPYRTKTGITVTVAQHSFVKYISGGEIIIECIWGSQRYGADYDFILTHIEGSEEIYGHISYPGAITEDIARECVRSNDFTSVEYDGDIPVGIRGIVWAYDQYDDSHQRMDTPCVPFHAFVKWKPTDGGLMPKFEDESEFEDEVSNSASVALTRHDYQGAYKVDGLDNILPEFFETPNYNPLRDHEYRFWYKTRYPWVRGGYRVGGGISETYLETREALTGGYQVGESWSPACCEYHVHYYPYRGT